MPCNFLWNVCHCLCDLCKLYSTWDWRKYHQCLPFVAKWGQRRILPCVSSVTPACLCSHNKPGCLEHKQKQRSHLLLCLPVNSADMTAQVTGTARNCPHWLPCSSKLTVLMCCGQCFCKDLFFTPSLSYKLYQLQCFSFSGRGWNHESSNVRWFWWGGDNHKTENR